MFKGIACGMVVNEDRNGIDRVGSPARWAEIPNPIGERVLERKQVTDLVGNLIMVQRNSTTRCVSRKRCSQWPCHQLPAPKLVI